MSPMEIEAVFTPLQVRRIHEQEEQLAHWAKFQPLQLNPGLTIGGGGTPGGLTPGGGMTLPPGPGASGGLGALGNAGCSLIPAGPFRDLCLAGVNTFLPGAAPPPQQPTCPEGTRRVGNSCVSISDILPGGAPFITKAGGVPVSGSFGMPGFQPMLVQQPIRRCPAGMALAKDGICYVRSLIPRKFRAHPPGKKPPLTGADASALRRIGSLQGRVKRLAKSAGLSMTVKRTSSRTKRKR